MSTSMWQRPIEALSNEGVKELHHLQAENTKLREQLADMPKCEECEAMLKCEECEAMLDCDECFRADDSQKERKRLDYENGQLRELVREMWLYDYAGKFSTARGDVEHVAMVYQRMCELGIEVDA